MQRIQLLLACLAGLVVAGECLNCYDCYYFDYSTDNDLIKFGLDLMNSFGDKKCMGHGAEFLASPSTTTEASSKTCEDGDGKLASCTKADIRFSYEFFFDKVSVNLVTRGCEMKLEAESVGCINNIDDYWKPTDGNIKDISGTGCACVTDLCNGSERSVVSGLLVTIALLFAKLL